MDLANLRRTEQQIAVAAARTQPEFAAFRRIVVEIGILPGKALHAVTPDHRLILAPAVFSPSGLLNLHLRYGLELAWLRRHPKVPAGAAALAAARAAALFIQAESDLLEERERGCLPGWVAAMGSDVAPPQEILSRISEALSGVAAPPGEVALIRSIWHLLGTADALMETGGDIRLQRDPRSALNGYGCSHRPRPWAVTFASSTASSSSERGYLAADLERLRRTAAMLAQASRKPVRASLNAVRRGLARIYGLPADTAVVLAASGTDTELLALALSHLAGAARPILNILIAPEETGRGVPMAARGVHFAVDTALGHAVACEAPIAGFRPDTELANIPLRDANGTERGTASVEAELAETIAAGMAAGKRVILHALDLSKTGLLAPSPEFLARMRAQHGEALDIVVDACQTRLSAASVRGYLRLGAVVLITGSKFFTGPPFAGALLLPEPAARRLRMAALPEGLAAYFGRHEFPEGCAAAATLPDIGNYGLALRWHAALAEMRALMRVPAARFVEILAGFGEVVREAIAANPALALLPPPRVSRFSLFECGNEEPWETLPSIFCFSLQAPHAPARRLTPAEARAVYLWLNADLSEFIPHESAASRICHIGQPVRLPQPPGASADAEPFMGVLRVSAGARLIAGEPSHKGLARRRRIRREFADLAMVFEKIGLILRHWHVLAAADPAPHYRTPLTGSGAREAAHTGRTGHDFRQLP